MFTNNSNNNNDWNLNAVVYGGAAPTSNSSALTATNNPFPSYPSNPNSYDDSFPIDFSANYNFQSLHEVYQQFCLDSPAPPAAAIQFYQPYNQEYMQMMQPPVNMPIQDNVQFQYNHGASAVGSGSSSRRQANTQSGRNRRRNRAPPKKVVLIMTRDELTADNWAWRKYGQKPIKGSLNTRVPIYRNYYRCTTSKGCAARRQVERCPPSPSGEEKFIVTYTGEHTHPRPVHRSSRNRAAATATASAIPADGGGAGPSNVNNPPPDVGTPECGGASVEDDDNALLNDMMMNDDDELFAEGILQSPPWSPAADGGEDF